MKTRWFLVVAVSVLTGCSVPQRTEISRHTVDMNLLKSHYPELYEGYMAGQVVIDDVYRDPRIYPSGVGVDYHYVDFVAADVRP